MSLAKMLTRQTTKLNDCEGKRSDVSNWWVSVPLFYYITDVKWTRTRGSLIKIREFPMGKYVRFFFDKIYWIIFVAVHNCIYFLFYMNGNYIEISME